MKKLIIFLIIASVLSCSSGKKELYGLTDTFVENLQANDDRYSVFDATDNSKTTTDSLYRVMPIGRLINVKILKPLDEEAYKDLEEDLKQHYKDDNRVNDVYISKAGTIMIDCRN